MLALALACCAACAWAAALPLSSSAFLDDFLAKAVLAGPANVSLPLPGGLLLLADTASCSHFAVGDLAFSSFASPRDATRMDGIAVADGLAMTCSFGASLKARDGKIVNSLSVDVAVEDASYHLRVAFRAPGSIATHLPSNLTLEECTSNFVIDPTRVTVKGAKPFEAWLATEVIRQVAQYVGPYIIDPILCGSDALLVNGASAVLSAVPAALALLPSELPRLARLEREVHPRSHNSSILLAPYSSSLAVKLGTNVFTQLLGGKSKRKPHTPVINEIIDARMGGPKIVLDFKDDAGAGYVLVSRPFLQVDLALILNAIEIDNLNTFDSLSLTPVPKSSYTVNVTMGLTGPFELQVFLQVAMPHTRAVNLVLQMQSTDLQLSADLLLALDSKLLSDANVKELLGCLVHALAGLQIPRLFTSGSVSGPWLVPAVQEKDKLPVVLQSFFDSFVFKPLHGGISSLLSWGDNGKTPSAMARALAWLPPHVLVETLTLLLKCPAVSRPPGPFPVDDFIRLAESRIVALLGYLVDDFIGLDFADFSFNRIVDIVAQTLSEHYRHKRTPVPPPGVVRLPGSVRLGGHVSHMFESFPPNATVYVTMADGTIGPLDTIRKLQVLRQNRSEGSFALDNSVELNGAVRVQLSFKLEFHDAIKHRMDVVDEFRISVQLATETALAIGANLALRLNFDALGTGSVALGDLTGPCLAVILSPSRALEILKIAASLGGALVDVQCVNCQSSGAQEAAVELSQTDLDRVLANALPTLESVLMGRDVSFFGGFNVTTGLDWIVHDMQRQCLGGPEPPRKHKVSKPKWIPPMKWVMGIAAFLQALGFSALLLRAKRAHRLERQASAPRIEQLALSVADGHRESGSELSTSPVTTSPNIENSPLARLLHQSPSASHVTALVSNVSTLRRDRLYLLGLDKSLVSHPALSREVRWGVVVLLLANFILFVSSTFFTMASIEILVTALGDRMHSVPMLELSLDECIDMMVEGRALLFALFVGGLSGIWPWMRVSGLLFVWVSPTGVLLEARSAWLEWLESLGRFVLAEFYLLLFFQATITEQMGFPGAEIDIETVPQNGLFLFLLASLMSLCLGEFIVQCHERVQAVDDQALGVHAAPLLLAEDSPPPNSPRRSTPLKLGCLAVWLLSLVIVLSIRIIRVEFMGFSGFGVDVMTGSKVSYASLGSLAGLLVDSDPAKAIVSGGVFLMVLTHCTLVVIAPLLECLLHFAAELRPDWPLRIPKRVTRHMASIDVIFFTLIVCSLQIHRFFDSVASQLSFLPLWIGDWLARFGASDHEAVTFGIEARILPLGAVSAIFTLAVGAVARDVVENNGQGPREWTEWLRSQFFFARAAG